MKMAAAVIVNIFVVPFIFALVVMVAMGPSFFTVAQDGGASTYIVFGGETEFEFGNGEKITVTDPAEFGQTIINNSADTIVVERKMYGDIMPDEVPVLLFVEPYTVEFFEELSLDYVFETPPGTIETSSYASVVSRYYLRGSEER